MRNKLIKLSQQMKLKKERIPNEVAREFLKGVIFEFNMESIDLDDNVKATMEILKLTEKPSEFRVVLSYLRELQIEAIKLGKTKKKGQYIKFNTTEFKK